MKNSIRVMLTLLGLLGGIASFGQTSTVSYAYDACGNRIQRTLGFKKADGKQPDKGTPDDTGWLAEANDSLAGASLTLFPNPTAGRFTLALSGLEAVKVHAVLCTMEGVVIEEREVTLGNEEFDLGGRAAGVYLLHLWAGSETQTWKIIKKN